MNQGIKGICRMSLISIRTGPGHEFSMISQLLFGEHYSVLEQQDDWLKIELAFDQSVGWIFSDQHSSISEEYFNQIMMSDYKICTDISGSIYFQKKNVHILIGSILPITTNELFKIEEQIAFNGSSKSLSQRRDIDFMKEVVSNYIYAPFLPGGKTPFGIDAGGLIQQIYKLCGYYLPRTLPEQMKSGKSIDTLEALPGDLVFTTSPLVEGFINLNDEFLLGINKGQVTKIPRESIFNQEILIRRVFLGI